MAAAVRTSFVRHLGIDLVDTEREVDFEKIQELFVTSDDEMAAVPQAAMVGFCIKEAVVKAVSDRLNRFIDLREIKISIEANCFSARLTAIPNALRGNWGNVGPILVACTAE